MCEICGIKNSTVVGAVVKNVRRCKMRTTTDRGAQLAKNHTLMYITKIATKGEGVYGQVINTKKGKLNKTIAHIRDCEFENTNKKWDGKKLI